MSRTFNGTTSNYLSLASVPAWPTDTTGQGITFGAWIKTSTASHSGGIVGMFNNASTSADRMVLDLEAGNASFLISTAAGTSRSTYSTSGVALDTWVPVLGRVRMTSGGGVNDNADIYHTNTSTTSTATIAIASVADSHNEINIGRYGDSTPAVPFSGLISNVVIWTAPLSNENVTAFFAATSQAAVEAIDSANLWAYWPLDTANGLADLSGNARTLTVNGTVALSTDEPFSAATDPTPPYVSVSIS